MKLTPIDIQQQQFRSVFRGVDPKEVDAFLDQVAHALEEAIRENNGLRDEARRKEAQLDEHRERERALKETMITATRISDDVKQQARKEAEIIISQAELQAEQILQNAHARLARVLDDINELKRQKAQFEASVKATLHAHQRLLEAVMDPESPPEREPSALRRRSLNGSQPRTPADEKGA